MIMSTLGLDNIAVAFALGPLQLGPRRTLLLGLAFGLAEAGMMLLGSTLGQTWLPAAMTTEMARAGLLATLGVAVLGLLWVKYRPADFVANAWTLAGLALLLGVDNLVAGTAPDMAAVSFSQIVANGAFVGALAAVACAAGGAAFRPARRWGAVASGLMLLALAATGIS
jgi:putative Mn2+ efflux pump MntP